MNLKNLSNQFLLAMPHLDGSCFEKSLIYICQHDKNGSMGLIINKPLHNKSSTTVLNELKLTNLVPKPLVYIGGPVNLKAAMILHDNNYSLSSTLKLSNNISLTSNKKILSDIKLGKGPTFFRLGLGYSGWTEGQLEKEIKSGDWLLLPMNSEFIFNISDDKKWDYACNQIGIDINKISKNSGLA